MQYSSEIVFLGVVHFRVVHQGSPWTRGQCFVHHLLNVFSFKVESNFLQVISKIIHCYCALLSNWNNGKRRNRRTGCYSKGSCNILSLQFCFYSIVAGPHQLRLNSIYLRLFCSIFLFIIVFIFLLLYFTFYISMSLLFSFFL